VILGGFDDKNYPQNNVTLFNIRSERCRKVVNTELFKFLAQENQAEQISTNQVIALVKSAQNFPSLIEYTKDANSVKLIDLNLRAE